MGRILCILAAFLLLNCSKPSSNTVSSTDTLYKECVIINKRREVHTNRDSILNAPIMKEIANQVWVYDSLFMDTTANASFGFPHYPNGITAFDFGPDHPQSPMFDLNHPDYIVEAKHGDSLYIHFPKHTFRAHVRFEADTLWMTYRETLDAISPKRLQQQKTDKLIRIRLPE